MFESIIHFLENQFANHGYWIVFVAQLVENGAFIGLAVPGDSILLLTGFFAQGKGLSLPTLIGLGILGAVIGDNISYLVGRHGGRPLVRRLERRYQFFARRLEQANSYFRTHGGKTVLTGRFVVFIRTFVPFTAGVGRMKFPKFFLYNLIGASLQVTGLILLGYFFGHSYETLERAVGAGSSFLLFVLALVVFLVWRRRNRLRSAS